MRCDKAEGVMHNSSAASAKELSLAAASKAESACTGGSLVAIVLFVLLGMFWRRIPGNNFSWIHDVFWVEGMLERAHHLDSSFAVFFN